MSKSFKLSIRLLQLVELRIEDYWLLNMLYIFKIQLIVSNAQLLNAEIILQSIPNYLASLFSNRAVKQLKSL